MTGPSKLNCLTPKKLLPIGLLCLAVALAGCTWTKRQFTASKPAPAAPATKAAGAPPVKTIVTPDVSLVAKVVSVNLEGRFVILNFPSGELPRFQQTLFLYRAGLKMAEVKITGPKVEMDNTIVADLISGNAQAGDTVRDE